MTASRFSLQIQGLIQKRLPHVVYMNAWMLWTFAICFESSTVAYGFNRLYHFNKLSACWWRWWLMFGACVTGTAWWWRLVHDGWMKMDDDEEDWSYDYDLVWWSLWFRFDEGDEVMKSVLVWMKLMTVFGWRRWRYWWVYCKVFFFFSISLGSLSLFSILFNLYVASIYIYMEIERKDTST